MELDLEVCRTAAVRHGLPLGFVVKEFHLFDVLAQVVAGAPQGTRYVLKGGTALNKVYLGSAQRFSEDIDLDLEVAGVGDAAAWCRSVASRLEGYRTDGPRRVRGTVQLDCIYASPLGGMDRVRIDAAVRRIVCEAAPVLRPAVSAWTHASVAGFHVYALEDLVTRKLHALCTRTEGKDVYDASCALPLCGGMRGAVAAMLEAEGEDEGPEAFLRATAGAVRASEPRRLRDLTNPFIPRSSRPGDWRQLRDDLALRLESLAG